MAVPFFYKLILRRPLVDHEIAFFKFLGVLLEFIGNVVDLGEMGQVAALVGNHGNREGHGVELEHLALAVDIDNIAVFTVVLVILLRD